MERRFYLGVAILLALLVLGIFSGIWVNQASQQVVHCLTQAEESVRNGNPSEALVFSQQAQMLWDSIWNRVAVVADHTSMDEIDGLFAQMAYYAQTDVSLFGAGCARVRELVSAVSDGHQFTWWNLL
jgi:hypothetical protein